MAKIYGSTLELIGNTPLVEVKNIEKSEGLEATVLVKLEYFNPAGSVKDRIAKGMIEDAEARGILKEGSTIIEPTSGNTGAGKGDSGQLHPGTVCEPGESEGTQRDDRTGDLE